MILKNKAKKSAGNGTKSLIVKVAGFVDGPNGEVGCKGTDLHTNKEVTVFLSTEGKLAENKRRKSLKDYRDGYRMFKTTYQMQPGGIISFDRTVFDGKKDAYVSEWANALAYDETAVQQTVMHFDAANLQVSTRKDGTAYGLLRCYDTDTKNHVIADKIDAELYGSLTKLLRKGQHHRPGFAVLMRNENEEVFFADEILKHFNKDADRKMSADEQAAFVCRSLKDIVEKNGISPSSYCIVPMSKLSISTQALGTDEDGKSRFGEFDALAKSFRKPVKLADGTTDYEFMSKPVFLQVSEDGVWANKVVTPFYYRQGQDLVLDIAKQQYDPAAVAELAGDTQHNQGKTTRDGSSDPGDPAAEEDQNVGAFAGMGM